MCSRAYIMLPCELEDFLECIDGVLSANGVTLKVPDMVIRGEHNPYSVVRLYFTRQRDTVTRQCYLPWFVSVGGGGTASSLSDMVATCKALADASRRVCSFRGTCARAAELARGVDQVGRRGASYPRTACTSLVFSIHRLLFFIFPRHSFPGFFHDGATE